jgi:hypothetical protein
MAFSVGTLTAYVQENENELLVKSILKARTVDLLIQEGTYQQGVKTSSKINLLSTDSIFQSGANCLRTPSGTTTITQRPLNVVPIAVVEDLCIADLDAGFMQKKLKKGWDNSLPFEAQYAEAKADTVAKQIEIAVWQGDTTSGNANLNKFDGFIKIIDAAGTAINANTTAFGVTGAPVATGTGIVAANVKSIINAMWLALPADIQGYDDIRIFCGWDVFYKYINAYTDQNLFNFAPTGSEVSIENGVVIIPGTNYKLTAVHGLDGTNRLFAARMYNFVVGTDLEHEEEKWKLMPDQFDNYLRFQMFFRLGVQVAFPDQIVSFKLT